MSDEAPKKGLSESTIIRIVGMVCLSALAIVFIAMNQTAWLGALGGLAFALFLFT